MPIGEIVLIPYGYMGNDIHDLSNDKSPGHMTLLEIKRTDEKSAKVRLFNAGEGSELEHIVKSKAVHPWQKEVSFADISNTKYWEDTLELLGSKQASITKAYSKLKDLKGVTENHKGVTESKSYRIQQINHCPKKSLQIWFHDQLKNQPILYQKFRIFTLDGLLRNSDTILKEKNSAKTVTVNHAISLWGGSDKITNPAYNIYYKVRGFISGPYVKKVLPMEDLQKMQHYSEIVKLSRESRLKILEGDFEGAVKAIKERQLTPVQKADLLYGLKTFCIKRNIQPPKTLFLNVLKESEFPSLLSMDGINEMEKLHHFIPFDKASYSAEALIRVVSVGLATVGLEQTIDFVFQTVKNVSFEFLMIVLNQSLKSFPFDDKSMKNLRERIEKKRYYPLIFYR